MSRRVQRRAAAASDVEQAVNYYAEHGDVDVAVRFIDAVEAAMAQVARRPHAGSLRFSHELGIPELRAYHVRRFPYVVFYVVGADVIDVWRVLHERRDLPNTSGLARVGDHPPVGGMGTSGECYSQRS